MHLESRRARPGPDSWSAVTAARKKRPDVKRPTGRNSEEAAGIEALFIGGGISLTPAETRVAAGLTEGLSYKEIAKRLGLSYHTIHTHVKAIHVKTGVGTTGQLLALIRRMQES